MTRSRRALVTVVVLAVGLAIGQQSVRSAAAQTNQQVMLTLTAPLGHPGAVIAKPAFTKDSVIVGEFNGTLAVSGGSASVKVPVEEEPNELMLEFTVPFQGIPTNYSVSAADFATEMPYFLPDPSPGGVIPTQQVGDPETDAFFVVSIVEVSDDNQAPTCEIMSPEPGVIEATIQDTNSGLATIDVRIARNATVEIPNFELGTTDPVIVTATSTEPTRTLIVLLKAVDEAGNASSCKLLQRRTVGSR